MRAQSLRFVALLVSTFAAAAFVTAHAQETPFSQLFPLSVVFSPDGKILASGGSDYRVRLWDPDTGKELGALEGHTDYLYTITISSDGKWLASGGADREVRLWYFQTKKERHRLGGQRETIRRVRFSPAGTMLASSCAQGTLHLWDTTTGKEIRALATDKPPGAVFPHAALSLRFTPDGKQLAFDNGAQGIQLVSVPDGKLVRSFLGQKDNIEELVFSADGATLYSCGGDRTIRAWDVATGKERRRYGDETMTVRSLALAPDEKTITYGTHPDGMVHIRDLATDKDLVAWKATKFCVVSIAYTPDSKKVAVARDEIAIHEVATGKRLNPPAEKKKP